MACLLGVLEAEIQFHTVESDPAQSHKLLALTSLQVVVFETCTAAGRITDLSDVMTVRRKTDAATF